MFVILIIIGLILMKYIWSRRKLYKISSQLAGPIALPLIGNGLMFMGDPADSFDVVIKMINSYPKPMRAWLGPKLVVIFTDVEHVEKLFLSTKLINKSDIYRFIADFLPHNLISNADPIWKEQRKLVKQLTTLNYIFSNVELMQVHIDKLIGKLRKLCGENPIEIFDIIHYCTFDIICELIYGINPDSQNNHDIPFFRQMLRLYTTVYERMMKPWLHSDYIYKRTSMKKVTDEVVAEMNDFTELAMKKSLMRVQGKVEIHPTDPFIDHVTKFTQDNPNVLKMEHIRDLLLTVILASSDTISIVVAGSCFCFGIHKDYQKYASDEVNSTFGSHHRFVGDETTKLKYLDMCVKDVMRLFPIAPLILRKTVETVTIEDIAIPPGCEVLLSIYNLHYNPKYWENPTVFYPDHFMPEAVRQRHKYAYVPFSSGLRSCAGPNLGMQLSKLMVSKLLQNFEFEADGKIADIRLCLEITLRFRDGVMVKIKERN